MLPVLPLVLLLMLPVLEGGIVELGDVELEDEDVAGVDSGTRSAFLLQAPREATSAPATNKAAIGFL